MGVPMKPPIHEDIPRHSNRALVWCLVAGLAVLVLLGGALVCGGVFFFGWKGYSRVSELAREFEQRGYTRVQGQVVEVTQPVSAPTVYIAQVLRVKADVHGDLAVLAQVAEIEATVNGDIDFVGQTLAVKKTGVVTGDIRCRAAQSIDVQGTVKGDITGTYQALTRSTVQAEKDS
ncbi:MAG: hypothetical protein FJ276_23200 [Planctomycetes bacterium]|nr:hypothetical protein [Planctomycetota bacterium]